MPRPKKQSPVPTKKQLSVVDDGPLSQATILKIQQLLLNTSSAARALNRSLSWMRERRTLDRQRLDRGLEALGPRWVVINESIYYRVADLERWIEERGVAFGALPFRGDVAEEGQP